MKQLTYHMGLLVRAFPSDRQKQILRKMQELTVLCRTEWLVLIGICMNFRKQHNTPQQIVIVFYI